jgi:dihydropteroate synthase
MLDQTLDQGAPFALAVQAGARVLRVHEVGPIAQTVRMAAAVSPR